MHPTPSPDPPHRPPTPPHRPPTHTPPHPSPAPTEDFCHNQSFQNLLCPEVQKNSRHKFLGQWVNRQEIGFIDGFSCLLFHLRSSCSSPFFFSDSHTHKIPPSFNLLIFLIPLFSNTNSQVVGEGRPVGDSREDCEEKNLLLLQSVPVLSFHCHITGLPKILTRLQTSFCFFVVLSFFHLPLSPLSQIGSQSFFSTDEEYTTLLLEAQPNSLGDLSSINDLGLEFTWNAGISETQNPRSIGIGQMDPLDTNYIKLISTSTVSY